MQAAFFKIVLLFNLASCQILISPKDTDHFNSTVDLVSLKTEFGSLEQQFERFREEIAQQLVYFRGDVGSFEQDLTSLWKTCSRHDQLFREANDLLQKSQLLYSKIRKEITHSTSSTTMTTTTTTTTEKPTTSTTRENVVSSTPNKFVIVSKQINALRGLEEPPSPSPNWNQFNKTILYAAFGLAVISILMCICIICFLIANFRKNANSVEFPSPNQQGQPVLMAAKSMQNQYYCRNDNLVLMERCQEKTDNSASLLHVDCNRMVSPHIHPGLMSPSQVSNAQSAPVNGDTSNSALGAINQKIRPPVEDDYCYYFQHGKSRSSSDTTATTDEDPPHTSNANLSPSFNRLGKDVSNDVQSKEPLISDTKPRNTSLDSGLPGDNKQIAEGTSVLYI